MLKKKIFTNPCSHEINRRIFKEIGKGVYTTMLGLNYNSFDRIPFS